MAGFWLAGLSDIGVNYDIGQQFWIEGLSFPQLRTGTPITVAFTFAGTSTVAFTAKNTVRAHTTIAGTCTNSYTGRMMLRPRFSNAGTSTVSFRAKMALPGRMAVTGTCTVHFVGHNAFSIHFEADGSSTAHFQGKEELHSAHWEWAGTSTANFDGTVVSGAVAVKFWLYGLGLVPGIDADGTQTYWHEGQSFKQMGDEALPVGFIWRGTSTAGFSLTASEMGGTWRGDGIGHCVISGTRISIVSASFEFAGRCRVSFQTSLGAIKLSCLTGDDSTPDPPDEVVFSPRDSPRAY